MPAIVVDPEVTLAKFRRELQFWKRHSNHEVRGWVILAEDEATPSVEIAFLAKLATNSGSGFLPAVACAVRLTYENYDLWPPSLTFIDAFTRQPSRPHVRAFQSMPSGPRDVLIDGHPTNRDRPFLCLAGTREYHSHPQHTGDDWLLHRASGEGSLLTVCDRIWRFMVRNVIGLSVSVQALPVWPLQARLAIQIAQGNVADKPADQALPSPKIESE